MRARSAFPLSAVLAALLILATARTADAGQTLPPDNSLRQPRTDPGHLRRSPYDPAPPPAIAEEPPPRQQRGRIVYAFDQPARGLLTPAPDLSALCRRGEFVQRINMLYRGFGPGERPLGVAYGLTAVNLIDPGLRRDPETVYFFDKQDTGRCAVFTAKVKAISRWFVGP